MLNTNQNTKRTVTTNTTGAANLGRSLVDTISTLHADFRMIKGELAAAQQEIARLNRKLDNYEESAETLCALELTSLRRQVAYHCHPDRGGDSALMGRMNALFDMLQAAQTMARTAQIEDEQVVQGVAA